MLKMTNEINDENIEKIKDNTEICDNKDNKECCQNSCESCVKDYLKGLLNKVK